MKKKKKYVAIVAVAVLFSSAIAMGAVQAEKAQATLSVEKMYNSFLAEKGSMSDEQYNSSVLNLLKKISIGDKAETKEYAAILKEITNDEYAFEDEDVFSVAKELLDVAEALCDGTATEGVQSITCTESGGGFSVSVGYIGCRGYTVNKVTNPYDEVIYYGEKAKKYDGFLGDSLIKVTLYDTPMSESWREKYNCYETYSFGDLSSTAANVRFMAYISSEHATVIYIGSNYALSVVGQDNKHTVALSGSVDFDVVFE